MYHKAHFISKYLAHKIKIKKKLKIKTLEIIIRRNNFGTSRRGILYKMDRLFIKCNKGILSNTCQITSI